MKMLKNTVGIAGVLVLLAVLTEGCQSVATTAAKLRNQEGNYDIAIELCQEALASNPLDAEAYFQLGFAYSQKDMVALAYENFIKAKELDPKKERNAEQNIQHNFAKHYKLGQSGYNRKDFVTSAEEFGLATQADPRQAVGFYNLGVAYAQLGDEDEAYREKAITAMDKVLELSNPSEANYGKALQVAGRQLAALGRETEARERFQRLIEEDPTSYDVIESLGNEFLNAQQWSSAVVFLKMAAEARSKIDADDFTLFYNIGAALYNKREECAECVDEAIAYYEKALALNDDEPQTIFNIAVSYVAQENYRNAADWLEKYVYIKSDDKKGWQLLARCYSELGEKDKAREAMTRFEQLRE